MPKIIAYQTYQSPPVQVGRVPDPGQLEVFATDTYSNRPRWLNRDAGFETVEPVLPIPNPLILGLGMAWPDPPPSRKVQRPDTQVTLLVATPGVVPPYAFLTQQAQPAKTKRTVTGEPAQPPSPIAAIPMARQEPNDLPKRAGRFAQTEPAHVINPLPWLPLGPSNGLPDIVARKVRYPVDNTAAPPWGTTNWVRLDAWMNYPAPVPPPKRSSQTDIVRPPPLTAFAWLPNQAIPSMLLGQVARIRREAQAPDFMRSVFYTDIPVTYADFWQPTPTNVLPLRRRVFAESVVNLTQTQPSYANAWGAQQPQPLGPRWKPQQTEAQPPDPSTRLVPMNLARLEQPHRFGRQIIDGSVMASPSRLAIPFIGHDWPQFRPALRQVSPHQGDYPLWVRDAPLGLSYVTPTVQWNRPTSAWRQDWTAAVPWPTITGLPDPNSCFDQVRLTSTPTVAAHATNLYVGSTTQIPGSLRLNNLPLDLTGATVTLTFTRPDATTFSVTATIYNAPAGLVYYTLLSTDLDVVGRWTRQWTVTIGSTTYTDTASQFLVQSAAKPYRRAMPFDLGSDWRYIDGLEPLKVVNPDASFVCLEFALRREARETLSAFAESEISVVTCRWHVWREHLGTFVPEPHGYAVDQYGSQWYITAVDLQTARSRYILTCVLQSGKGVR